MPKLQRAPLIDAIKTLAAQLIVLHHLAWYGPMSDVSANLSPWLGHWQGWLAEYGRYAVAAFLTVGGYLAAQNLSPRRLPPDRPPWFLILQRYARLVGPYALALVLAMVSTSIARRWMTHDSIGATPDIGQFIAHLFLLHDLLDYEALSAGIWYIAIDFQLYALLVMLLWGATKFGRRLASADFLAPLFVAMTALASLLFFNRLPGWDDTALYFFGAYALGVGSRWAVEAARPHLGFLIIATIGIAALSFDFRPRIAVALVVALSLGLAQLHLRLTGGSTLSALSRTSYALFLVHFPICLLVSTAFNHLAPHDPYWNALGVLVAWFASNIVAFIFYRYIEVRLTPLLSGLLTRGQAKAA